MPTIPSPLSQHQLERILGLDSDSPADEIARVSIQLLTRLEARRETASDGEHAGLDQEIEALTTCLVSIISPSAAASTGTEATAPSPAAMAKKNSAIDRQKLLIGMIALLSGLLIILFVVLVRSDASTSESRDHRVEIEPAQLIVESRPSDAELRIRPPDSDELLLKITGAGARVELEPGRYEIEIFREDCPDRWTREIDLDAGELRRYEPTICAGAGELTVRSNVANDRLRIDDLDLGATRAEPHLLGVGDHEIRIDKEGYAPFVGKVRVKPDTGIEIRAELVAMDPTGKNSAAGGTKQQVAALPFDVVSPSAPPNQGGSTSQATALNAAPPAPPLLSDPIRPERLKLPKPVLDFDDFNSPRRVPKGGSTSWHDAIADRVIRQYDRDGSGAIDRSTETESISCAFWQEVEKSFDDGGLGLSMSRLYGFDGSEWHPKALGFAREQRGLAYQRMRGCGLAP